MVDVDSRGGGRQHPSAPRGCDAVGGWMGMVLLAGMALCAGGCTRPVPEALLEKMKSHFNETMISREPLCIEAGPFPYRTGAAKGQCDRCQDLEQAGLLSRRIVEDASGGFVEYALNPAGEAVYRIEPDPEHLALILAHHAKRGRSMNALDRKMTARPRMCFGQTRFHGITEALAPLSFSGSTYTSVKLVAEATDTSGLLFDPRIAVLDLPVPPKPEPGGPALYPPRVMTFQTFPGDDGIDISNLRYGAWVDEP